MQKVKSMLPDAMIRCSVQAELLAYRDVTGCTNYSRPPLVNVDFAEVDDNQA